MKERRAFADQFCLTNEWGHGWFGRRKAAKGTVFLGAWVSWIEQKIFLSGSHTKTLLPRELETNGQAEKARQRTAMVGETAMAVYDIGGDWLLRGRKLRRD